MDKKGFINTLGLSFISLSLLGQAVSSDSLESLKKQKEAIKVSEKLIDSKTELAKLENQLAKKNQEVEETAKAAQSSAEENRKAAAALSANAQDKKLADNANKAAKAAMRDAKSARKAADDLAGIQKDIDALKSKIGESAAEISPVSNGTATSKIYTDTIQMAATQPAASQGAVNQGAANQAVVQRNIRIDSLGKNETPSDIAQRVVDATYKNYPQQPGQPSIIINNIILPPDYNRGKISGSEQPSQPQMNASEKEDYEAYKAWVRQRRMQNNMAAEPAYAQRDEMSHEEMSSSPARSRLTFKERFGERPPRNSGLWVIPVVGVHASSFKADFKNDEANGRIGWNAGLDFRIHMKRFFIQPGAHYFNSSLRVTSNDSISSAPLLDGPRIHSLKVPLMIGLYLTKANSGFFKFNIKGGAVGNYVMAVDKSQIAQFAKKNIEDFSYGLNAGIGLEFGLITLDLSHEWGITTYFKDNQQKNNILRATLGIKI